MSTSDVTPHGLDGTAPGREATVGSAGAAPVLGGKRRRRGEEAMVPDATFTSYYGKPVINKPVWEAPDIPGYFYLGGLAGASSVLALGADLTERPALSKVCKVGAAASISLGLVGLVHDLGRPARFINMLRVFKPTSPMNVGSWALAAYGPASGAAAFAALTGRFRLLGNLGTAGAAAIGPFVAAYTGALITDTAVPSWHEGWREMPFVFVGSAASAAGGLGMLAAPCSESMPARRAAVVGGVTELVASKLMERRMGKLLSKPYHEGKSGRWMRIAEGLTAAGTVGGVFLAGRNRVLSGLCGASLLAASALTRFAIFEAGIASANNPEHTIVPQRQRLEAAG